MHIGAASSQELLERLTAAVESAFGSRQDNDRATSLKHSAEAMWLLSQQPLSPYEAEPDFIATDEASS